MRWTIWRTLVVASVVGMAGLPAGLVGQAASGERVPARFDHGLVDVVPTTRAGDTVRFCTDSGGGVLAIRERTARRQGWLPAEGKVRTLPFPDFREGASFPGPRGGPARLRVVPDAANVPLAEHCDGFLGAAWYGDRTWTLDYPSGRLLHHPDGLPDGLPGRRVALGFQVDSAGRRTSHFPRIDVEVDGDSLPLLLDTGAQLMPTAAARDALGLGPDTRGPVATSFVVAPVFERWRREHPDWTVVPDAGTRINGHPMIRVPSVEVGGREVGPVWFVRRPEGAFDRVVNPYMDRPVKGALGGSALRHLRLTISYPEAVAVVSKPEP